MRERSIMGIHGAREIDVLDALYTERRWSRAIERRLGHLAPVVEVLTTTEWLEKLVEQRPEQVRGDGPSVVPQEAL